MKKLFFGLTAIVIVITGIFTFEGCEKEENEQYKIENTTKSSVDINETLMQISLNNPNIYGQLHNEICDYIITNYADRFFDPNIAPSFNETMFYVEKGVEYFIQNGLISAEDAQQIIDSIYSYLSTIGDDEYGYFALQSILENIPQNEFSLLLQNYGYSTEFSELLYPVIQGLQENPQMPWDYLENNYLCPIDNATLTNPEEQLAKDIFVNVCCYSAWFWDGEEPNLCMQMQEKQKPRNPNLPKGVKDCTEWTIIMDGLGTVMGSMFTVVGSAAIGTAFSIGSKRDCEQDGKYR